VDFEGNTFELKLYPPLRNVEKGVYLVKGGNILDYRAKANALSKPRSSRLSTTLVLQPVQKSKHKHKEDKNTPLEIRNKVQKYFVVVHKKHFTNHGSQVVKQVSRQEKIFECTTLSKPITHEKLQHSDIGSYLLYLNVEHYNVPLSFKRIQFVIVKHS